MSTGNGDIFYALFYLRPANAAEKTFIFSVI